MPTYEYACDLCGHKMEIFQSIRDERLITCPACEKDGLKRLIGTGAGLIFKGSGFYQTDYKSGSAKEAAAEKASADKTTASGSNPPSPPSSPSPSSGSTPPSPSKPS